MASSFHSWRCSTKAFIFVVFISIHQSTSFSIHQGGAPVIISSTHHHTRKSTTTTTSLSSLGNNNLSSFTTYSSDEPPTTLSDFLSQNEVDPELSKIIMTISEACSEISQRLSMPTFFSTNQQQQQQPQQQQTVNVQGETQTPMDIIANDIFISQLSPHVAYLASEEEEDVIIGTPGKRYEVAFDPLDGSSNLSVNIPTGSIFGIYPASTQKRPFRKPGTDLIAAGYALYSSSLQFTLSLSPTSHHPPLTSLFTHHPPTNRYHLTTSPLLIPPHGPYYSLNEARSPDWPPGLSKYVHDAKRGSTPSRNEPMSSRYVCSLVADVHRTLLKGGWAGNPRPHLRLLFEAAPLAHVVEMAGGVGSDGRGRLLELEVGEGSVHERVCVFLGSKGDVEELVGYGDIQQGERRYKA